MPRRLLSVPSWACVSPAREADVCTSFTISTQKSSWVNDFADQDWRHDLKIRSGKLSPPGHGRVGHRGRLAFAMAPAQAAERT